MPETSQFDCQLCELANSIDDMVQCDECHKWYHYGCAGFDDGKVDEDWKCPTCVSRSTAEKDGTNQSNPRATELPGVAASGNDSITPRAQLNLKLLEEQKTHLMKEIELEHKNQLQRKLLLLEKETWNARFDILNATGGEIDSAGCLNDWSKRLNQIVASPVQQSSASSGAIAVPVTSSARSNEQLIPVAGAQSAPARHALPSSTVVLPIVEESAPTSQPIANTRFLNHRMEQPSLSAYAVGHGSSFMHEFLPGGEAYRLGSSTPTTATRVVPAYCTSSTQCLPPSISSVGQPGSNQLQNMNHYQQYQVTNSVGNLTPAVQVTCTPYASNSVGFRPQVNVNTHTTHAHSFLPTSYYQTPQVPLNIHTTPVVNSDDISPTPRQLAARQVMPKELPSFSGHPEEWPMFFSAFNTSTEACGYSFVENLGRLQRCLRGSALEAVRSRLLLPASVPNVMQTLQLLYGRPEQIIYALLQKVRDVAPPKAENLCTIVTFGMAVQNFCDHLEAAGQHAHLSNPVLLQELIDKLPASLKLDWVAFKRQFMAADLRVFSKFMSQLVSAAAEVTLTLDPKVVRSKGEENPKRFVNAHIAVVNQSVVETPRTESVGTVSPVACFVCGETEHRVKECNIFKNMHSDDRWKAVHRFYLCRICLGKHGRKPCRSSVRCGENGCELRHHPLLHGASANQSTIAKPLLRDGENRQRTVQSEGVNAHHTPCSTLLRMVPVKLYNGERSIETVALLDEASAVTLLEKDIADAVQLQGTRQRLCLGWTGNITREENNSRLVKVQVSSIDGGTRYTLEDVRTIDSLALPAQSMRYEEYALRYSHLRKLPVRDFEYKTPGILIGAKNANLTTTQRTREGRVGEPVAAKTRLGWAIYGPVSKGSSFYSCNLHMCASVEGCPESTSDKRAQAVLEKTTKGISAADPRSVWNLPANNERNPNKPTKIRTVWEAAATVDSMLLKGPDLVQPLLDVLCGFRERQIAVVGDIMKIFLKIWTNREDRYRQSLLRPGEPDPHVKKFIIDVAIFGATCSPCPAQLVKDRNIAEYAEQYSRAGAIQHRQYGDEDLQSFDNEDEAHEVIEEGKNVHSQRGFTILIWLSKSTAGLEHISEVNTSPSKTSTQIKRVLGMQWLTKEDVLLFSSDLNWEAVPPTKRGFLVNQLWCRWIRENLPTISMRTKWFEEARGPNVGDPFVIVTKSVRNGWRRGQIISVMKARNHCVTQVLVKTSGGVQRRPVTMFAVLGIGTSKEEQEESNAVLPEDLNLHYGSGDVGAERHHCQAIICN